MDGRANRPSISGKMVSHGEGLAPLEVAWYCLCVETAGLCPPMEVPSLDARRYCNIGARVNWEDA